MSQITRGSMGTGLPTIETLTGNSGGAVGPDGAFNINILGSSPMSVAGNPGTNTLTISVASASEIQIGVVELATAAETITGTSTTLAVHPSGLNAKLGTQTANGLIYGQGGAGFTLGSLAAATNGQLPIGNTGNPPTLATLTAGSNITIMNGAGSITISATGGSGGVTVWNEVLGVAQAMAVNNGYITNNALQVVCTLPAVAVVGDVVRLTGKGAGGWHIAQNAGQTIYFGTSTTTTGVAGFLESTAQRDGVELLCITANTEWNVLTSMGNLTVA